MKNRRQFDLVVLGAEPCGLAAAACAVRAGATCAVIKTGLEIVDASTSASIPNFVWRQLGLQSTDFSSVKVQSRVSLFQDGRRFSSFPDDKKTTEALTKLSEIDGALWADYKQEMRRKFGSGKNSSKYLDSLASTEIKSVLDSNPTDSIDDVLEDFFENQDLKTHLASVAGLAFGLGGEEPGSGYALASAANNAAWRISNSDELQETLELVCERLGVVTYTVAVKRTEAVGSKFIDIDFELGEQIRTKKLMAATARIANAAGFKIKGVFSPLMNSNSAEAHITVKLSEKIVPWEDQEDLENATFYVTENIDELRAARDAVLEGRIPEHPPLAFEVGDREITVRTPFCPRTIETEDGPREWTGQDRQILGKQVIQRLGNYLNGSLKGVQRTDVKIYGAAEFDRDQAADSDVPKISVPSPDMNEIAMAAKLALNLVSRD